MGHERVTIQNLELVQIDQANHLVFIKGSVPGPKNSFVQIKQNVKNKPATPAANVLSRKPVEAASSAPVSDAEQQA